MRSSLRNIVAGLALALIAGALAIGLYSLPFTYTFLGMDFIALLRLVAVLGLALAGYGLWQRFERQPQKQALAKIDAQLIFRAMIAFIGLDNKRRADEIEMTRRCCKHFFQRDMDDAEILQALKAHEEERFAGFAFGNVDRWASSPARINALAAATVIAMSDGPISDAEQAKLVELARRLDLPDDARARAAAEAERLFSQLK